MKIFKKAFTLTELLVVIAIIGTLSSVVGASVNSARSKSRDAKRVSDIRTLQTQLEFFYDKQGRYPEIVGAYEFWDTAGNGTTQTIAALNSTSSEVLEPFVGDPSKDAEALSMASYDTIYADPNEIPERKFTYVYSSRRTPGNICGNQSYMIAYRLETMPAEYNSLGSSCVGVVAPISFPGWIVVQGSAR